MLVAKGSPAHLHVEVRDYDGILSTPTGNVAVVVKDIDDTTVASGNAAASQHGHDTGIYSFTLPTAVTGTLGVYIATATWTLSGSTVTRTYEIEVVSEFLFEIHELRDLDSSITESSYSADRIRAAREAATSELERAAQVSFSKRSKRVILNGDGTSKLVLPDVEVTEILGCTIYGEDTGADVADDVTGSEFVDLEVNRETGVITRTDGQWFPDGSNNVVVDYEHGFDYVPAPVRRAAMKLAIEHLVPSGLPARATSQSTDIGDFRISVANVDLGRWTGIPDVDSVIDQFGRPRPRLG